LEEPNRAGDPESIMTFWGTWDYLVDREKIIHENTTRQREGDLPLLI
jgi:hypothetical protein